MISFFRVDLPHFCTTLSLSRIFVRFSRLFCQKTRDSERIVVNPSLFSVFDLPVDFLQTCYYIPTYLLL